MTLCQQDGAVDDDRGRLTRAGGRGDEQVTVGPRRARCPGCTVTHVLLPASLVLRRADTTEGIGAALTARARGAGHRTIAARLGRPVSTVRRWLRRVQAEHSQWLGEHGVQHAYRANPDILNSRLVWPTPLGDALNLLAAAALAYQRRWDWQLPVWTLIAMITQGRLLPPPQPLQRT